MWRSPMAAQWACGNDERTVAICVLWSLRGEANLNAAAEARLLGLALGITPLGRLHLRWVIDDEGAEAVRAAPARPRRIDRYDGLRGVTDDGPDGAGA